jgi:two-component system alkaline phosphatase synthesis response regulator PhoP
MKKIAIVEDEADLRDLLKLHITREGFEPVPFQNGDSFLDFIRQGQVDLVLLDIMLPGTDGLSICRILRSEDKTRNLPIVLLTAKGTELDIVVGLELGADDYITKPFSTRELIARVKSLFRRLERIDQEKVLNSDPLKSILTGLKFFLMEKVLI